jgi:hypothetical protein
MARRGFEESSTAVGRLGGGFHRALEIVKIGSAQTAADRAKMKLDVLGQCRIECSEQKAAQLVSRRATQPHPPPDFADRVDSLIAASRDGGDAKTKRLIGSKLRLDCRHAIGRQHLVQIGEKIVIRIRLFCGHLRDDNLQVDCLPHGFCLVSIEPLSQRIFDTWTRDCGAAPAVHREDDSCLFPLTSGRLPK